MNLLRLALRHPISVMVVLLAVLMAGAVALRRMPREHEIRTIFLVNSVDSHPLQVQTSASREPSLLGFPRFALAVAELCVRLWRSFRLIPN